MTTLNRIDVNPRICHGKPVVRGTRIMVWQVLDLLQSGLSFDDIRQEHFPRLTHADIQACLRYANALVKHEEVHLVGAARPGHAVR